MSVIGDEVAEVVADLAAVGIPATADPAHVWVLAAQSDVAALIGWPEQLSLTFHQGKLRFTLPVRLASRGPDLQAQPRLWAALPTVLQVLAPVEAGQPDRITQGDAEMPAYLINSPRSVGC